MKLNGSFLIGYACNQLENTTNSAGAVLIDKFRKQ